MTKIESALNFHKKGFNCAQSAALPFCDDLGLDPILVSKSLEGFGAGMGGFELTCGALSAAIYIAGIINADGNLNAPSSKRSTYIICKELCSKFKESCGSAICGEIKGLNTGKVLSSCDKCIICSVELIENMLK